MALPIKIVVKNRKFANNYNLKVNHPYTPTMMDNEGYFIRHPYNDEELHIPFKYLQELSSNEVK